MDRKYFQLPGDAPDIWRLDTNQMLPREVMVLLGYSSGNVPEGTRLVGWGRIRIPVHADVSASTIQSGSRETVRP